LHAETHLEPLTPSPAPTSSITGPAKGGICDLLRHWFAQHTIRTGEHDLNTLQR
jgi:hypothetical protein